MTMSESKAKPFTIVVGVDDSEQSELALSEALSAASLRPGTHVHVVRAIPLGLPGNPASPEYSSAVDEDTEVESSQELRRFVDKVLANTQPNGANASPFERLTTHVRRRNAAETIAEIASEVEADLVVVGTHGRRGVSRFLLGSVAEAVVRLAPCPVLVVRPTHAHPNDVPKIEPACPRCREVRRTTNGREYWCEQHRGHHPRPHTYLFSPVRSGHQSGLLYPIE
jgi:nucleotide-binding universal stress UspA family protein